MSPQRILVYKGRKSQTGLAATKRFPGLIFEGEKESFEQIAKSIIGKPILAILPLWNSHGGEIKRTTALEMVFDNKAKIHELWPMRIMFECVGRRGISLEKIKRIIIVFAAEHQCSKFLDGLKRKGGVSIIKRLSTVESYEEFSRDACLDAVLCAPGQWDKDKFIKLKDDASNPYNFTAFLLLGNVDPREWRGKKWGSLRRYGLPKEFVISGVEMSIPTATLTEEQQDLLDDLTKDTEHIDEIPRIIFIFRRDASRCGIIMESTLDSVSVLTKEDGSLSDILIKNEIGDTNKQYTEDVFNFIRTEFTKLFSNDFIKHIGTQTCLYACPDLKIMVHGFEPEVVEVVVRKIINKYFELIDKGLPCSRPQRRLFNKYKQRYYDKGDQFIDFVQV